MSGQSQSWHQRLWRNIMERIHENLAYKDFTIPTTVVQRSICTSTGLLATSSCPSRTEYFAEDNVPTQSCSGHYTYTDPDDDSDSDDEKPDDGTDTTQNPDNPDGLSETEPSQPADPSAPGGTTQPPSSE